MIALLQGEAEAYKSGHHERGAEEDGQQPDLGLEVSVVSVDIPRCDPVVDPVPYYFAQDRSHDRREVEKAYLPRPEAVKGRKEDGERRVDPDDPRKGEHCVNTA